MPQDLARKSLLLLGSTWGGSALGMLVSILVGRALGPEALGSIGFSTGIVGLVMAALLPGFAQAHLKRLAEGQDPGRCLGTMLAIQGALHAVLVAALLALWSTQGLFATSGLARVFLLLLGAQVATNFADVFLKVFIAREWVVPHTIIVLSARLVRLLAIVAYWPRHLASPGSPPPSSSTGRSARLAAATVLGLRYRLVPRAPTRESLAGYWRFARPFTRHDTTRAIPGFDRPRRGGPLGRAHRGRPLPDRARALGGALVGDRGPHHLPVHAAVEPLRAAKRREGPRGPRLLLPRARQAAVPDRAARLRASGPSPSSGIVLVYGEAFRPAALPLRILVLAAVAANVVNPYTYVTLALDQAARFVPVNVLRAVAYTIALVLLVPARPVIDGLVGLWPGEPGAAAARLFLILFPCWVYVRWTRELAGLPLSPHVVTYLGGFVLLLGAFHALRAGAADARRGRLGGCDPGRGRRRWPSTSPTSTGAIRRTADNLRYTRDLLSPADFIRFLRSGLRGPARP